jgi:hypothetical protein
MLGSSWVAAQLAAFQEGLSSTSEWVVTKVRLQLWHCLQQRRGPKFQQKRINEHSNCENKWKCMLTNQLALHLFTDVDVVSGHADHQIGWSQDSGCVGQTDAAVTMHASPIPVWSWVMLWLVESSNWPELGTSQWLESVTSLTRYFSCVWQNAEQPSDMPPWNWES